MLFSVCSAVWLACRWTVVDSPSQRNVTISTSSGRSTTARLFTMIDYYKRPHSRSHRLLKQLFLSVTLSLTYELDLVTVKVNHHAKYLGQRLLSQTHTYRHTQKHTTIDCYTQPLKRSVTSMLVLLIVGPKCTLTRPRCMLPLVSHGEYADETVRRTDARPLHCVCALKVMHLSTECTGHVLMNYRLITLAASSGKRTVTIWCSSVCPSVWLSRLF